MDLSVSATTAFLPQQAYSPQGGVGARQDSAAATANGQPGTQAQEARTKNPAAEVSTKPGYAFEVDQQNHKIMKVSDAKGVLIYQIPSKGQLALVEAEESAQKRIQLTA